MNKKIFILITILSIILFGLTLNIKNDDVQIKNNNEEINNIEDNEEKIDLTIAELEKYNKMFNDESYNGFLTETYSDIHDVNLVYATYDYWSLSIKLTDKEWKEFGKLVLGEEINETNDWIYMSKIYDGDTLRKWYYDRTGHDISENKCYKYHNCVEELKYLKIKDYYFDTHSDTRLSFVTCISGYKDKDSIFHIKYDINYLGSEIKVNEVTFKESENGVVFISNLEA